MNQKQTFALIRTRAEIETDIAETMVALTMYRARSLRLTYGTIEAARVRGEIREGRDAMHDLLAEIRAMDDREAHWASCAA